MDDPRVVLLLALGDDELVMGHRHAEWTGVAPLLEEDLAFSSIAQDEIGHAVVWYTLAAQLTGHDPDALGLGRRPEEYRHAVLVERPNDDWAYTVARHYLYDTAEDVRLRALAQSTWPEAAAATGALLREERYHLLHARAWLERLAAGTDEARRRLTDALAAAFAEAPGLFEPPPGEPALVRDGVLPVGHAELQRHWLEVVADDLARLGLPLPRGHTAGGRPVPYADGLGGRQGRRSEDFAELWQELTATYRLDPSARW